MSVQYRTQVWTVLLITINGGGNTASSRPDDLRLDVATPSGVNSKKASQLGRHNRDHLCKQCRRGHVNNPADIRTFMRRPRRSLPVPVKGRGLLMNILQVPTVSGRCDGTADNEAKGSTSDQQSARVPSQIGLPFEGLRDFAFNVIHCLRHRLACSFHLSKEFFLRVYLA